MELLKDMHRFGPAPSRERELAAAAANMVFTLVLAGVLVFALGRPIAAGVLVAVLGVWITARLVVAFRRLGRGDGDESR